MTYIPMRNGSGMEHCGNRHLVLGEMVISTVKRRPQKMPTPIPTKERAIAVPI